MRPPPIKLDALTSQASNLRILEHELVAQWKYKNKCVALLGTRPVSRRLTNTGLGLTHMSIAMAKIFMVRPVAEMLNVNFK